MNENYRTVVVGVFENQMEARRAVDELRKLGFSENEIGVAARTPLNDTVAVTGSHAGEYIGEPAEGEPSTVDEGAVAGAMAGVGVGGLWAIGIAAGFLPAIGPAIAGGILASLVASAAVGAVAGGVVGALIGLGIPEEHAQYYGEKFRAGHTIVTVRNDDHFEDALQLFRRMGAYDVNALGPALPHETISPRGEAIVENTMHPTAGGTPLPGQKG